MSAGFWTTKPPPGVQIDRAHPLARGLSIAYFGRQNHLQEALYQVPVIGTAARGDNPYAIAGSNITYKAGQISNSSHTIIASYYYETTLSSGTNHALVGHANANNEISVGYLGGTGYAALVGGTAWVSTGVVNEPNRFRQVACVTSAANLHRIYVDGLLKATDTNTTSGSMATYRIGQDTGGTNVGNVTHVVQYIYVYNRALSQSEIAQLYAQPYAFMRTPNWATRFTSSRYPFLFNRHVLGRRG